MNHDLMVQEDKLLLSKTKMIPKKIHQIWIGNSLIPERCKLFMERMKVLHPDWEYKLWTNDDIFETHYKEDKFLQSYWKDVDTHFKPAHIADRARLLILRDFGGVYVDADANPIKSFNNIIENINENTSFFGGVRPKSIEEKRGALIDCTVMGASKDSRFIKEVLSIYKSVDWAWGGRAISDRMFECLGPDVSLFNYKSFYDTKITEDTIVIHDTPENRLWSWK